MTCVPGTEPYAWPWDGALIGERLALVVTGWDSGWGAAVGEHRAAAALHVVHALAAAVARVGGLALAVHHVTDSVTDPVTDHDAIPLAPPPGATLLGASGIDACFGSALEPTLRRGARTQVLLAGLGLETTVHSTMRSLNDRGYECLLVTEACAPVLDELVAASLHQIRMSGGIFGAVGALAPLLATLDSLPGVP